MIKQLVLALCFFSCIDSMEPAHNAAPQALCKSWLDDGIHSMRELYFPQVGVAQTEQGNQMCIKYLTQMMPLALPNGLRCVMACTYLRERYQCADLPRIIPHLRGYMCQVITQAIAYRSKHGNGQSGNELQRAIECVNSNINAHESLRELWLYTIGPALKAYHESKNSVIHAKELK